MESRFPSLRVTVPSVFFRSKLQILRRRSFDSHFRVTALFSIVGLFALFGCGGGGGGESSHPPAISSLSYSPTSALVNDGGGAITINGTFNFSDTGGDISSIHITTYDASGNITNDASSPIPGTTGVTTGTIYGQVIVGTADAGVYSFRIYITDSHGSTSNVLSGSFPINYPPTSGPMVRAPGYAISLVASGLGAADGIAIGPTGDIFVVDNQGGRILKIDPATYAVSSYATGIAFPSDLTFDIYGRLFVNSSTGASSNIYQVFPNGAKSIFSTGYSFPTSVQASPDGNIFVANSGIGAISRVSSAGLGQLYLTGFSVPDGPFGLSLDAVGALYFVDHGTGRVLKADQSKNVTLMATLSPFGPAFTEVDQEGNIYVSDSLNAAIYRISGGAVTVFASGFSGKSHPPVIGPTGMAFDSAGAMYVADGDRLWKISRIVPFELTYNFSGGFHVYGQEPIPQLNGFDYYFTPLMLNSSLSGKRVRINEIAVSVPGTSTGYVVNWDLEIFLGSSSLGFPEGQFVATLVDPVSGYTKNAPTRVFIGEGEFFPPNPTNYVFSTAYNFGTATLTGSPTPRNLREAVRTEMSLTNGLYAQIFFWTGDNRDCYVTFGNGTLTIKGEIIQ